MYDLYRRIRKNTAERLATRTGAGLPDHLAAKDWKMMPGGTQHFLDDVEEDIAAHGFSYFKLA